MKIKEKKIIIHLLGGIVYLIKGARGVKVEIRDFDNERGIK